MIRSILVPLDGSPFAEHALPLALSLARRTGATLHLAQVHVPVLYVDGPMLLDDSLNRASLERERAYLDALTQRLREQTKAPIHPVMPIGGVADELIEQARLCATDLIVMTTHGRGALSRFWLGSVADELIRHAPAPVLLVRPHDGPVDLAAEPPLQRILIPLDGSPVAERVLATAVAVGAVVQAEYHLFQAIPPVPVFGYDLDGYAVAGTDVAMLEQMEADALAYVERIKESLQVQGFRASARVVIHEQPAAAILEQAKACGCDLIALETHGRGGLPRLLLGSVADKVVRGAGCAVLVHRDACADSALAEQGHERSTRRQVPSGSRGVGILP